MNSLLTSARPRAVAAPRWAVRYWQIGAFAYAAIGILAMWMFSPRVPYADQWNHYAHLLQRPFWIGVFSADNGHAEVLPNLLRLIELQLGSQELVQIVAGMLLAALSVYVLLDLVLRDRTLTPTAHAASAFAIVFGIYWLGNTRALTQEHDAVHVYTVMVCLSFALRAALSVNKSTGLPWHRLLAAMALCLIASLSFGSGIASFVALVAVLVVQRARWTQLLVAIGAALGSVLLYRALPGAVADPAGYDFSVDALILALRLLGSPFVYLFWPLLDPAAAAAVPGPLRDVCVAIANGWTMHFGDIHRSTLPQAAFGLIAVALTVWNSWRVWLLGASRVATIGVALAWFSLSVAGLIAITRTGYFAVHPDQVYAPRYLPWLTLSWSGLLVAGVAQTRLSRSVFAVALSLPLLALPSEVGMAMLGRRMQNVAEDIAVAGAVGVFPTSFTLGETDVEDLQVVLPLLHEAHTAMFAWPEAQMLGQAAPANGTQLVATGAQITPAQNRLGDLAGSEVSARIAMSCNRERVLVVADKRVVGLLRAEPDDGWRGVVQGQSAADALRFLALCNDRSR
jgi:hypothetical protein